MITFESVTKAYSTQYSALDNLSFHINPGEFVFILGHSGAGKTTLLRLILREIRPTSGRIVVADHDLNLLPDKEIPHLRRQIGSAFQDFKLLPEKTALENICLAIEILGKPKSEILNLGLSLMEQVGLPDKGDLFPSQLSGGELQRVTIARALALDPVLLFADEPTGNLDAKTSSQIIDLLSQINENGTTVIMATHDQNLANKFPHRQIHLQKGKLLKDTKPQKPHKKDSPPQQDSKSQSAPKDKPESESKQSKPKSSSSDTN